MKNHRHTDNDNLENFFLDRVHDYQEDPGDGMWDRLEPKIPPRPGSIRRPNFYWASGAVAACLILFLGVSVFQNSNTLNTVAAELENNNNAVKELNDKIDLFQNAVANKNIDTELDIKSNNKKDRDLIIAQIENKKGNKITLPINSNATEFVEEKNNIAANNSTIIGNINSNNVAATKNIEPIPTVNKINDLPVIVELELIERVAIAEINSEAIGNVNKPFEIQTGFPAPSQGRKGWFVGLSVQPQITARITSFQNEEMARKVKSEETFKCSKNIGMRVGYDFNDNWSLYSGLRYEERNSDIHYNDVLEYSSEHEVEMSSGGFASKYNKDLDIMAMSDVKMELEVTRASNIEMSLGTAIPFEMETSYRERELEIPVVAQYTFGNDSKWNISAKMGIVGDINLSENLGERNFKTTLEGVNINEIHAFQNSSASTFSMDYLVGAGVSYNANDKLNIFIEPTFEAGLHKPTTTEIGKKYPYTVGLETGLAYRF